VFEIEGRPARASPNLLPNPLFRGAIVGTPGTDPTAWTASPGTPAKSIVQVGPKLQMRVNGTAGTGETLNFFQDSQSTIVEPTDTVRFCCYGRLAAGSVSGVGSIGLGLICFDRTGAFTNYYQSSNYVGSFGATSILMDFTQALSANDRKISAQLFVGYNNGAAIDITMEWELPYIARVG